MRTLEGCSILVVEDEDIIREMIHEELESQGAVVVSATSGRAAFEAFQKQKFDAVVSDVRMPGGDGVSLMRHITALCQSVEYTGPNRDTKLFLCTAYGEQSLSGAEDLPISGILTKPFSWSDLINTLTRSLRLET
jgi:CheY-like chemotaxis protein